MYPDNRLLEPSNTTVADQTVPAGALDGVTILRYAHLGRQRASGGVEQYLRHLDRGMLQKHRLTILQTYLQEDDGVAKVESERIGMGEIRWLPIPIRRAKSTLRDLPARIHYVYGRSLQQRLQDGEGPCLARLSSVRGIVHHDGGHLRHESMILSDYLSRLVTRESVDLVAFHWLSYDTGALMKRAVKAGIPFVVINHFDNSRLSILRNRASFDQATAIGVVSSKGIPDGLKTRCVNLSDAVDTEFFAPEKARPLQVNLRPVVLMPARIDVGKGHEDLIEAARILVCKHVDLTVCFVGATDSESLAQRLRRLTLGESEHRFVFLGEKSPEEIRDWYAMSSMVVLPSHSEGLGRVLLEAQAMKKPVVAYDCGGVSEALLPNETGFLVGKGNVEVLADKMCFLLENESERTRMGEAGREFVSRRFSIPALIQRHEMFYLRALAMSRAS
jgi:glycosyltransferase involved in cell wall biosynthesis